MADQQQEFVLRNRLLNQLKICVEDAKNALSPEGYLAWLGDAKMGLGISTENLSNEYPNLRPTGSSQQQQQDKTGHSLSEDTDDDGAHGTVGLETSGRKKKQRRKRKYPSNGGKDTIEEPPPGPPKDSFAEKWPTEGSAKARLYEYYLARLQVSPRTSVKAYLPFSNLKLRQIAPSSASLDYRLNKIYKSLSGMTVVPDRGEPETFRPTEVCVTMCLIAGLYSDDSLKHAANLLKNARRAAANTPRNPATGQAILPASVSNAPVAFQNFYQAVNRHTKRRTQNDLFAFRMRLDLAMIYETWTIQKDLLQHNNAEMLAFIGANPLMGKSTTENVSALRKKVIQMIYNTGDRVDQRSYVDAEKEFTENLSLGNGFSKVKTFLGSAALFLFPPTRTVPLNVLKSITLPRLTAALQAFQLEFTEVNGFNGMLATDIISPIINGREIAPRVLEVEAYEDKSMTELFEVMRTPVPALNAS